MQFGCLQAPVNHVIISPRIKAHFYFIPHYFKLGARNPASTLKLDFLPTAETLERIYQILFMESKI